MRVFTQPLKWSLARAGVALTVLFTPVAGLKAQPQPPAQSSREQLIPDQKLDAVAAAYSHVSSLEQKYEQDMAAATTPAAKEQISKESSNAMEKAIAKEGLSVDEYNSIIESAQNDPDVREKLLRRIGPAAK